MASICNTYFISGEIKEFEKIKDHVKKQRKLRNLPFSDKM